MNIPAILKIAEAQRDKDEDLNRLYISMSLQVQKIKKIRQDLGLIVGRVNAMLEGNCSPVVNQHWGVGLMSELNCAETILFHAACDAANKLHEIGINAPCLEI